jgi:hypothetical protein
MFGWMLGFLLFLGLNSVALSQDSWASRDYDFASRQLNDFTNRFQRDLVNPVSRGVRAHRPTNNASQTPTPNVLGTEVSALVPGEPKVPALMAAHYPSASRQQAERVFLDLLSGYSKIERQFDIPKRDVAGSVAAFLAGSYMAYRNVDFPDEHFKPLVAQMRQIIGTNPDFAKASNAEKQEMYEQMAILGMFMATTQMASRQGLP